ncbi:MAG: DPP IV N-terminal domain-containing protein [Bacteroidales bacterium]
MKLYKKLFATTLLLLSFIGSSVAVAQNAEKKNLTQEQILKGIPNGILNQLPRVQKWQDKENIEFINTTKDGADIFSYNVKTKKKTELGKKPKTELLRPATELKEFLALPNIKEYKNYTLSPNKKSVAFTNKDNNLCVYNVDSKEIKQLTNDGTNVIMNGYASWVYYEEILGRGSRYKAFWWSPDSKQLAFYKFDDTNVPMFPIYDSRGQHGYITETRYPKAGDNNPEVKIAFVNIESGNTVWADFDEKVDQYFGIPFWNADGSRFIIPWMPREQNHLVLYTVNPANGSKNPMYDEQQKTWIDWMSDMNFTATGFYMVRDFDLWEQIYFQSFDGKKLEKITDGKNWGVNIIKVDEKEGAIYFTARREISTRNDFYRVDLKTKEIKRLSLGEYNYTSIAIAPDNKHFVASYSNSVTPTKIAVISIGKKPVVDVIADSKGDEFDKYNIAIPQMLSITTSDGYVLPAQVIWPINLDPSKKYPVIVNMYGGPNSGTVMDSWRGVRESNQWWANEGVIQISIDHRASGHCGKEGLNFLHRNLLNIELKDYIEWIKFLYTKPFVNRDKIGITGFSYGGSMTMLALTDGSDYFKYGIAGGGVYDYTLYDSHYTERYMDRPQDNPIGYKNTRIADKVAKYKGDKTNFARITHGLSDDNVHMQNTIQLVNALEDNRKQFELSLYPGEYHGYRGEKSLQSDDADYIFWYRYLLDKDAPTILFK